MRTLTIVQRITVPDLPGMVFGPNDRALEEYEVTGLAVLYWPLEQVDNAVKVAKCESGFRTGAWAYIGEDSRGLWQPNVEAWPTLRQYDLFDPQINAYWAAWIWAQLGWRPWTCAQELGIR